MVDAASIAQNRSRNRFVFSLSLAVFCTSMLDVLSSLFLVDIAVVFFGSKSNVTLAIVSQIVAISSIAAIVFGILNGILSIRFRYKTLMLLGALCIVIGALGCFFAPSFLFMMIFYPFDGIGTIIVIAMAFSLIGEFLPLERRAKSIGLVASAGIFSSAIGFAWAGFIGQIAGWRSYLLFYVIPISFLGLIIAYFMTPASNVRSRVSKRDYINGFKQVLVNKSAIACLIGNMLITAAGVWSFFAATFWRQEYDLPVLTVGIITLIVVLLYAAGSITGGRITDKVGRKPLAVISWAARGLLIASIVIMPTFWGAFLASCLATFVGGIAIASGTSLIVEQAPAKRGTMMSINGVFGSIGVSLGISSGGLALALNGFQLLGVTLGMLGIASAIVLQLLAKDPSKKNSQLHMA